MKTKGKMLIGIGAAAPMVAGMVAAAPSGAASGTHSSGRPIDVEVFSPETGHVAGIEVGAGSYDLEVKFPGDLTSTGFNGLQLTGPATHANPAPFPGSFSPGQDDRMPGLVVLVCGTTSTAPFSGRARTSRTCSTSPARSIGVRTAPSCGTRGSWAYRRSARNEPSFGSPWWRT